MGQTRDYEWVMDFVCVQQERGENLQWKLLSECQFDSFGEVFMRGILFIQSKNASLRSEWRNACVNRENYVIFMLFAKEILFWV